MLVDATNELVGAPVPVPVPPDVVDAVPSWSGFETGSSFSHHDSITPAYEINCLSLSASCHLHSTSYNLPWLRNPRGDVAVLASRVSFRSLMQKNPTFEHIRLLNQ